MKCGSFPQNMRRHRDGGCHLACADWSTSPLGTRFGSRGAKASYLQRLRHAFKIRALLGGNLNCVSHRG
ncbi:protein of unknown function [Rhodovastum atsumiense]|nr:protein of unknown function [Rhodovastum atsumiense]